MIWFEFERAFKMLISYFPEETIKNQLYFIVWEYEFFCGTIDIVKNYK